MQITNSVLKHIFFPHSYKSKTRLSQHRHNISSVRFLSRVCWYLSVMKIIFHLIPVQITIHSLLYSKRKIKGPHSSNFYTSLKHIFINRVFLKLKLHKFLMMCAVHVMEGRRLVFRGQVKGVRAKQIEQAPYCRQYSHWIRGNTWHRQHSMTTKCLMYHYTLTVVHSVARPISSLPHSNNSSGLAIPPCVN